VFASAIAQRNYGRPSGERVAPVDDHHVAAIKRRSADANQEYQSTAMRFTALAHRLLKKCSRAFILN